MENIWSMEKKKKNGKGGKYLDLFRTTLRQLRENFEKTPKKNFETTLKQL